MKRRCMLRIEDIADLTTAKRVAQLLEPENKRLHDRLHSLVLELAAARGQEGAEQYRRTGWAALGLSF